ncbi:MAG: hypothetical protein R2991_00420 [Thermoanaerobaculia bacterium]
MTEVQPDPVVLDHDGRTIEYQDFVYDIEPPSTLPRRPSSIC